MIKKKSFERIILKKQKDIEDLLANLEHHLITISEGHCLGSNLSFSTFAVAFKASYLISFNFNFPFEQRGL